MQPSSVPLHAGEQAPYFLSEFAPSLAAGESTTLRLIADGRQAFGITRLIPSGADLDQLTIELVLNETLTVLPATRASALRNLFLRRALKSPLLIRDGHELRATIKNVGASAQPAGLIARGYQGAALQRFMAAVQADPAYEGLTPYLVATSAQVAAGGIAPASFTLLPRGVVVRSLATCDEAMAQTALTFQRGRHEIWGPVAKQAVQDLYGYAVEDRLGAEESEIGAGPRQVLTVLIDNLDTGAAHTTTVLLEAYG